MTKKIMYKGKQYPIQFNFIVFKEWEKATGRKFTEIQKLAENAGATEVVDVLSLLYFALCDASEDAGQEVDFSLKQFIRSLDMTKTEELIKLIDLTDGEDVKEGQP